MDNFFNREAEITLIGTILKKNDVIAEAGTILNPDDFSTKANELIFAEMLEMYKKKIGIDMLTVASHMSPDTLRAIGGIAYLLLNAGPLAPIQVTVIKVQEGQLSPAIFGIGTVEARRNWMVGPTVAGRVLNVRVDVGDSIKAGQLLAEMDPVDLEQKVTGAAASVAKACAFMVCSPETPVPATRAAVRPPSRPA